MVREQDYFNGQTRQFRKTIGLLAGIVTVIMALGAIFAALNSMYAAVAARGKEIATLRAIGFGGLPVVVSVMMEALLLALVGGIARGADRLSALQQPVGVHPGPELHPGGVQLQGHPRTRHPRVWSSRCIIGMIGGFLPAIRAARLPVTTSLREL